MKSPSFLISGFQRLLTGFCLWRSSSCAITSEPALRSELFNAEQMAAHAMELAARHHLRAAPAPDRLLERLDDNEAVLNSCCRMFTAVTALARVDQRIVPAGEWLLDNYYLVEEQIRTARRHLPEDYSRELPQLADGPSAGLPRVYDIALENISHGDGRLDSLMLRRFVDAYQTVTPLTLGELWAIPIMLRLALVENLRRVAGRMTTAWHDHILAAQWADRLIETAEQDRKSVVVAVAEMAGADLPLSSAFVAEFARRLQGQNATLALPLSWLEERLGEQGFGIDELIQMETQQQAADQVSISNSMTSLRLLSALNWRDFVEDMSVVERILRRDPSGVYARMDFHTRDHYRHSVERLARHSGLPEEAVAGAALELARTAPARAGADGVVPGIPRDDAIDIRTHVGYFLTGDGLIRLERGLGSRARRAAGYAILRGLYRAPLALYLGLALALTILFSWPLVAVLRHDGWSVPGLIPPAMLTLFAASGLALRLVNWLATLIVPPRFLPRLDYSRGIPATARTVAVIPTLIAERGDVDDLMEKLEVHFLANRDEHLQFGLLTDFKDGPREVEETDAGLLAYTASSIEALNRKYADGGVDPFFACHRPRRWNPGEQAWMGYERKRGKLCEFNALLRGEGRDRFQLIVGNTVTGMQDPPIRYVITLDADTQLPRDSARRMIGAMSHPLNRPIPDPSRRRIRAGYGILQPLVGVDLPSAERSPFSRLFSCDAGIDPYSRAISDVYQDLFGQGSFIGKGIYDVDAFLAVTRNRFPDNSILSHDLIESCYVRSGLLSDVQLYESYPSRYSADVSRRHRWIRGDWQLLPWLFPRTPLPGGASEPNPLTALSRWKIADNLRRSLVPGAMTAALLSGWFGTDRPAAWTLALLVWFFGLPLLSALWSLCRKPAGFTLRQHLATVGEGLGGQCLQAALELIWLPHEAWYSLDAAARTLWRMLVSRRHLMQWNPSHEAERTSAVSLPDFYRLMWICPALGMAGLLAAFARPAALAPAGPFLLLWLAAPAIAWRMSRPSRLRVFSPTREQTRFLRALARRTWAFFDHYVRPEDNWLPPDNMQEAPRAAVAHRTSPTNMGLALLAHLAAHDFGYLSGGRLLDRLDKMLGAMSGLTRYRNHFYNWYSTETLEPLPPHYISTVDSGNLAGHLLTLRPGLLALPDEPVFDGRLLQGLEDTAAVLGDIMAEASARAWIESTAGAPVMRAWKAFRAALDGARSASFSSAGEAAEVLGRLLEPAERLEKEAAAQSPEADGDVAFWTRELAAQCRDVRADLAGFALPAEVVALAPDLALPTRRRLAGADLRKFPAFASLSGEARERLAAVQRRAREDIETAERLAGLADELANMDFCFLFDPQRDLLSIGYNIDERHLDASYYDLLASEARLTYFVAISQNCLPRESWFALGRMVTGTGGAPVLLSWSGSMFEYLMPMLVMPTYEASLLDQTCRGAVERQIAYGSRHGLPWGISESCYNTLDACLNYQYRAFGVPGLGLKPGLGEDLVLAPYASALALMVAPEEACANLRQLARQGLCGRFGMYESVDYTAARLPRGQRSAVIRAFMAHHQGMSLLALAGLLLKHPMQRRFLSDPRFLATDLLLQERVSRNAPEYLRKSGSLLMSMGETSALRGENKLRIFTDPDRSLPAVQLLSNGQYHVMVSSGGGGYSRYRDIALTRWHEDPTSDNWGAFCYLRDVESGDFWSAAHQPTLRRTELFEAIFSEARAEFRVREHDFDAHTEIAVSPEDDIELRRIRITNRGRTRRGIEITSYAEVVLAPPRADAQHPAFSNLFVETELVEPLQAIICTRRPRDDGEPRLWLCHLLAAHGADIEAISYETDRARFLGRGRTLAHPAALDPDDEANGGGRLSNTAGAVLDPIVSIRCRLTLAAGQSVTIDLATGVSSGREGVMQQIEKIRDRHLADRVFGLAWTQSQVLLHQFNATLSDARMYQRMAASVIYANAGLRAGTNVLNANTRSQSALWGQSISGDLPIVLVKISDVSHIDLVARMLKAHAYWRVKGLLVDLIIWNEESASYRQRLQELIIGLIPSGAETHLVDRPGGVFVRPAQQLSQEDRILIQAAARVIVSDTRGSLEEQVYRRRAEPVPPRSLLFRRRADVMEQRRILAGEMMRKRITASGTDEEDLILGNPYGGFTPDGSEYVITLREGETLPAPWANVLANADFGTVISESGNAYTWKENAHEFRLTPWMNDPVRDAGGEALYLRDEENGRVWSPTPLPRRGSGTYRTRHGFGYSVFEHVEDGISSEVWTAVAPEDPIKFSILKIRNESGRPRRLSVTGYVEWVLGDLRSRSAMHIVTEADPQSGAIFARNAYSIDFPGRLAFFGTDFPPDLPEGKTAPGRSFTCDRAEFIGRNQNLSAPAAMGRAHLSGRAGPGLDPCAAIQTVFDLPDGAERETVFLLGAAQGADAAAAMAGKYRSVDAAKAALRETRRQWRSLLDTIQVETPDASVNALINGWLMYQVVACRFRARSGYYQSGGAFGFRDQLQDSMAMIHVDPAASRGHLLMCAAHQFPAGDVLHWWHPPLDRGVRTRCSDDYLWLPLAVSRYVAFTGDRGVLDEEVGYIDGRELGPDQESYYDLPIRSQLREPLYRHCVRAIERSMARGSHGLPLMGSGDWNDGMNKVGQQGRGESVWLGFFLYAVLLRFADVARLYGDPAFAGRCADEAARLRENLEAHGWDGEWYRRAYFDDGTPLGTAGGEECRIDSIAQSWSVLSGAAPDRRRRKAIAAHDARLVRPDIKVLRLLEPAFDRSVPDPGYIKGYVPGVRENGGQYTHAAVWAVMAHAALGDGERAWELFDLINPIRHGDSAESTAMYKVEPYVVAADVYTVASQAGRGGWTWYTGAAGWMYRLLVEALLGLEIRGDVPEDSGHDERESAEPEDPKPDKPKKAGRGATLRLRPVLPAAWRGFRLRYRFGETTYVIDVRQNDGTGDSPEATRVDGKLRTDGAVPLRDDGREHKVEITCANRHISNREGIFNE